MSSTPIRSSSLWQEIKSLGGSFVLLAATFTVAVILQQPRLRELRQNVALTPKVARELSAEKRRLLETTHLMPSFGFDNAIADLAYLDFLQYFAEQEAREKIGYQDGISYFDLILDRDPRFFQAYYYLSTVGSTYTGQPERSVALMDKALARITPSTPEGSYYLWRVKGIDEYLFLDRAEAAARSMEMSANWGRIVNTEESRRVANISQEQAQGIRSNPDSKRVRIMAWGSIIENAVDPVAVQLAIRKIHELGGTVVMDANGRARIGIPPESRSSTPQRDRAAN
jgi:tetratricopeptide (TPR) repeat protein